MNELERPDGIDGPVAVETVILADQVRLYRCTLPVSHPGDVVFLSGALPVRAEDLHLLGFASTEVGRAHMAIEYSCPERLELEQGDVWELILVSDQGDEPFIQLKRRGRHRD